MGLRLHKIFPHQIGSKIISLHANIALDSHMGETTGKLGNYYAPHGDPNARGANRQATTLQLATSVPTVHLGATTLRSVRLA